MSLFIGKDALHTSPIVVTDSEISYSTITSSIPSNSIFDITKKYLVAKVYTVTDKILATGYNNKTYLKINVPSDASVLCEATNTSTTTLATFLVVDGNIYQPCMGPASVVVYLDSTLDSARFDTEWYDSSLSPNKVCTTTYNYRVLPFTSIPTSIYFIVLNVDIPFSVYSGSTSYNTYATNYSSTKSVIITNDSFVINGVNFVGLNICHSKTDATDSTYPIISKSSSTTTKYVALSFLNLLNGNNEFYADSTRVYNRVGNNYLFDTNNKNLYIKSNFYSMNSNTTTLLSYSSTSNYLMPPGSLTYSVRHMPPESYVESEFTIHYVNNFEVTGEYTLITFNYYAYSGSGGTFPTNVYADRYPPATFVISNDGNMFQYALLVTAAAQPIFEYIVFTKVITGIQRICLGVRLLRAASNNQYGIVPNYLRIAGAVCV